MTKPRRGAYFLKDSDQDRSNVMFISMYPIHATHSGHKEDYYHRNLLLA